MELWQSYKRSTAHKEKEESWEAIIKQFLQNPHPPDSTSNLHNEIGCRFLTEVDRHCQEGDDILQYLISEGGLQLLLALNQAALYMTSCCSEVCNLLASLITLAVQYDLFGEDNREKTFEKDLYSAYVHFEYGFLKDLLKNQCQINHFQLLNILTFTLLKLILFNPIVSKNTVLITSTSKRFLEATVTLNLNAIVLLRLANKLLEQLCSMQDFSSTKELLKCLKELAHRTHRTNAPVLLHAQLLLLSYLVSVAKQLPKSNRSLDMYKIVRAFVDFEVLELIICTLSTDLTCERHVRRLCVRSLEMCFKQLVQLNQLLGVKTSCSSSRQRAIITQESSVITEETSDIESFLLQKDEYGIKRNTSKSDFHESTCFVANSVEFTLNMFLNQSNTSTQKTDQSNTNTQRTDQSGTNTQKIDHSDTSTQRIDLSDTSTQQIDQSDTIKHKIDQSGTSTQKIDHSDTSTQRIDQSDTSTQQIDQSDTIKHKIDQSDTSTQQIDQSDTSTQQIDQSDTSTQQVDQSDTITQNIDHSDTSTQQIDQSETRTQHLLVTCLYQMETCTQCTDQDRILALLFQRLPHLDADMVDKVMELVVKILSKYPSKVKTNCEEEQFKFCAALKDVIESEHDNNILPSIGKHLTERHKLTSVAKRVLFAQILLPNVCACFKQTSTMERLEVLLMVTSHVMESAPFFVEVIGRYDCIPMLKALAVSGNQSLAMHAVNILGKLILIASPGYEASLQETIISVCKVLIKSYEDSDIFTNKLLLQVFKIISAYADKMEFLREDIVKHDIPIKCLTMMKSMNDERTMLPWLHPTLRIIFQNREVDSNEVKSHLTQSFLSDRVLSSELAWESCLALINASSSQTNKPNSTKCVSLPVEDSRNTSHEESGYEADGDSDHDLSTPPSRQICLRAIDQAWLYTAVTMRLVECSRGDVLTQVLDHLYNALLSSKQNAKVMFQEGFFDVLLKGMVNMLSKDNLKLRDIVGMLIVILASCAIETKDLKNFFNLFKIESIPKEWLSTILLKLSSSERNSVPRNYLCFGPSTQLSIPFKTHYPWPEGSFTFSMWFCATTETTTLFTFGCSNVPFRVSLNDKKLKFSWLWHSEVENVVDEVEVDGNININEWNHLVILLKTGHPSQVTPFVNGCEGKGVTLKHPSLQMDMLVKLTVQSSALQTGHIMLFRGLFGENETMRKLMVIYLYSLGPNNGTRLDFYSNQATSHIDSSLHWDSVVFKELSFCMNTITERLAANGIPHVLLEQPLETLATVTRQLQKCIVMLYDPRKAGSCMQQLYERWEEVAVQFTATHCTQHNFLDALNKCGGINVLLYLHAKIAETSCSATILESILICQRSCLFLQREMSDNAGYALLSHVILTSPQPPTHKLVGVLINCMCSGHVVSERGNKLLVLTATYAVIQNVCILQMLLPNWRILLQRAPLLARRAFFHTLACLVRPDHPHCKFNIMQFQRARVAETMLMAARHLQQENGSQQLDDELCTHMVAILRNLLQQPADLPVLRAVCAFLVATHPTVDTLTLHSSKNFYLIPKHVPTATTDSLQAEELPARRSTSFGEADMRKLHEAQVNIFSREQQTEIIITRYNNNNDEVDNKLSPLKPIKKQLKKGHRRIQSDGMIKFQTSVKLNDTSTQDYDIISDSELPADGHEEYLVVDGFIEQKVESFTPQQRAPVDTCLLPLRLRLTELLHATLSQLPDVLVATVFGKILKVEHLLVLVNQTSDTLRETALECLSTSLKRSGKDYMWNFVRFMGFHLLSNILHQHKVTVKIVETCLGLMAGKTINNVSTEDLKIEDCENTQASVVCMALLQGCTNKPHVFNALKNFLVKMVEKDQDLPSLLLDNGFSSVLNNIVVKLCDQAPKTDSRRKETFSHLCELMEWLVGKAIRSPQTFYFQMLTDLLASLDKKPHKTCRFLKYFIVQRALSVFKKLDTSIKSKPASPLPFARGLNRKSSVNRIIHRIRTSVLPGNDLLASARQLEERLRDTLQQAVHMATSKWDHATESTMLGQTLLDLQDNRMKENADRAFQRSFTKWIVHNINNHKVYQESTLDTFTMKEEIFSQGVGLVHYMVSPLLPKEVRLQTVLILLNNRNTLKFLLNSSLQKSREQFTACLNNLISIPNNQLTSKEDETINSLKRAVHNYKLSVVNGQLLKEEFREIKTKRKEEEEKRRNLIFNSIVDCEEILCQRIVDHGMEVSKVIVDLQDRQRQELLRLIRDADSKRMEVVRVWKNLTYHLTQERAVWYDASSYPCSWQLDPTEGPQRMRRRLQRCRLNIPSKFFQNHAKNKGNGKQLMSYLFEDANQRPVTYSFKTNDIIRYPYHCLRVTPADNSPGEFLIGETHVYFVVEDVSGDVTEALFSERDILSISWRYEEIKEIQRRRYSLQNNALEIFLISGRTFLLSFNDTKARDEVYNHLMSRELSNLVPSDTDLLTLTNRWKDGLMTNFEYLMELNKQSGRSFNDLMQYPVFPFVLADYTSPILDLYSNQTFRNLNKPIACQDRAKEEKYIENYNYLKAEYEVCAELTSPYHYSSHYSNSGTVLHFLVRLPPFTSMFLMYQDNQFDIPDRTFHSIATTWSLSSFTSSTDVKELIPEFFFLQEFLINQEGFDMGHRQNGMVVNDVDIPEWAEKDARLFTLVNMQALESDYVSEHLNNWIDLVFGYKQTGPAAIKATNVFHPATYFGVDVNAIEDNIHRRALQTMIETYGQTPLQLFTASHPKRKHVPHRQQFIANPLKSVIGIEWGDYCGSLTNTVPPTTQYSRSFPSPVYDVITSQTSLDARLCARNTCLVSSADCEELVCWEEGVVHHQHEGVRRHLNVMRPDLVTCCAHVRGALFVGGESGVLHVWPVLTSNLEVIGARQHLLGHDDAITTICINQAYSIVVTASRDETAIIWDLNRLCYVRSLAVHESSVTRVAVSDVSGDIATTCSIGTKHSRVYLWSVNGKLIGDVTTPCNVTCLCFSNLEDGKAVNVLVAGTQTGQVWFWDTWTLNLVRKLHISTSPITAVSFSGYDARYLYTCDEKGTVTVWSSNETKLTKPPKLTFYSL